MEWALLGGLSDDDRRAVLATARRRRFERNEVVFHEADPGAALHLIAKGRVAVRATTPLGDIATLNVLGAGSHFGELALVARGGYRTASIVALEPTETLALHRDDVEELRRRHAHVDRILVDALASHVARLSAQLLEALYISVEQRVRRRLLDMADLYGDDAMSAVVVPLTQDHLAGLAGTSRQTVNKVLRELEDDGVVVLGRGRTEVIDRPGLAKRAR